MRDDQAYEVFTSLLPDTEPYKAVGKTLWEALRNGLAHNFRPDTIKIEDDEWRFTISSHQSGPRMQRHEGTATLDSPEYSGLSSRVIPQIDAYEQELRTSADARLRFREKSKRYIKTIPAEAARIADALRSVLGETHS